MTSLTTNVYICNYPRFAHFELKCCFPQQVIEPWGGKPPKAKACCLLPSCGGLLAMFQPTLGLAAQLMKGFGIWVLGQNTH